MFQDDVMKVLVTGASGLLGSALLRAASQSGAIAVAAYNSHPLNGGLQMDVTEQAQVQAAMQRVAPDYVIHAAAFTNVDACEIEPQRAWDVNALGTKHVADACEDYGAKLVYVSTDYVFDGEDGPYSEEDPTHPINVYGESKLAGERFTLDRSDNAVARVCVLYGPNKPNFVTWVIDSLRTNTPINVVSDQYNTPTYVGNCARALLRMCELDLAGVYHVSGREQLSRYAFACAIAGVFALNEKLINVTTTDTLRQQARRPMNSSLRVAKAERALGMRLANVREGLTLLRDEWQ
jgi:dTDP-4-dehydrorhamnose reductase